jgi:hypothetical protein
MSQRTNNGEGVDSELQPVESGNSQSVVELDERTSKTKATSHDSNSVDFCTPGKSENKERKSGGSSNSSNSSGSGGDNNYSADCSGDGGSDDNQSSDDTSTKPKQHAMMLDSSAMVAHHHHQQQLHHHHKHKSRHYNDNTSTSRSSSSNDDEVDMKGKNKSRASLIGQKQRSNQEGIEQAQQQLSMLSTNVNSTSAASNKTTTAVHHSSGGIGSSNTSMIDPQIDLSLVNHIPSSSLILPLHATATAALLQWNQNNHHHQHHLEEPTFDCGHHQDAPTNDTSRPSPLAPIHSNSSVPLQSCNDVPVAPMLTVENYIHLMDVRSFFS